MDSDSPALVPPPSFCAADGPDGLLTIEAPEGPITGVHAKNLAVPPAASPTTPAEPALRVPSAKRLKRSDRSRVLVVDDEPMMCELVGFMLAPEFEVVCLSSVDEALAQLRAGERFDVVLSDLMMPGLSGMDLFRVLMREQPVLAKRMIFMTGGTFTEAMNRFLAELGADPLMKPFGRELVFARVHAQLARMI